ncbi:putative transcriptional regulator, Crp/Fnr family [Halothece sp. PCC 7418]|uniref:cyclic nucleotide-binding domain-containing protein n=1 Tax=Halothece sp. (strain PCC 7418) TaxID=65093 RepID=UPI0002A0668C|nr:cyclic nucleotide-binding domain-containing protein [Halothece sp. PCC 7418]AFZ43719.1 putative transcriptional regulator, Crp/Fnr family [Halothece sp. PCC 7418]
MINQFVEQRFNLSTWKVNRLTQFLMLAVTMLTFCIMAMNIANSLFLSNAGAEYLPLSFILLGLFSTVAYGGVSQVIDRFSRVRLFQYTLFGSVILFSVFSLVLHFNTLPLYFCISITAFFQFDLFINILYPNLITDYFTTLEYKRYAPFFGIAQAVGILLGGLLTTLLAQYLNNRQLLGCVVLVFGIAIAQVIYLENSQPRLESSSTKKRIGLFESLRTFPDLVQRYPLVFYLASSSFLFILIYVMSEFLWFSTYANHFTDSELTGFLGQIRIITSTTQIVTLFCITRPLLRWLGVTRMNVAYPMVTLAALLGFALRGDLKSAIALNINGDSINKGLATPVHQLNYNAIPPEFSGRVRTLTDGIFYAVGLTLAGVSLLIAQSFLSAMQIGGIAIILTTVGLLARLPMGRLYAEGLESMIRSNTLELDEFNYRTQLPAGSSTAIQDLIINGDPYTKVKGLEFARRLGKPSQFLPEVKVLLEENGNDAAIRLAVVDVFGTDADTEALDKFKEFLDSDRVALKTTALEILIANQDSLSLLKIQQLLQAESQKIRLLAALVVKMSLTPTNREIEAMSEQVWDSPWEEQAAIAIARVIGKTENRDLIYLLEPILSNDNATLKKAGLEALAKVSDRGDIEIAEMASRDLKHPNSEVRAAAFHLLGVTRCEGMLHNVGMGLGDADPRVRQEAAQVLATYGEQGLALAKDSLSSRNSEVVNAAITAITQVRTKKANEILLDYLAPDFRELNKTQAWQKQIPQSDPNWRPLAIAISDYHNRVVQKVLYILSCLGHSRTVNTVSRAFNSTNPREVANAVEVLATLPQRRFALPLMPILEQMGQPQPKPTARSRTTSPAWLRSKGYKLLLEALEARDRWIRIGALIVMATVPFALMKDPDPLVKNTAQQLFLPILHRPSLQNVLMNRLLLLKNVALFKNLSLEELLLIDKALEQEQVLADQTIFSEGKWGTHLYIIAEGSVRIVKDFDGESQDLRHLSVGEYFGEVSLFDEAPHWESAIALQDCTLLKLEKSRFISVISQRPHIILEICRFLSQRLRETDKFRPSSKRLLPPSEEMEVAQSQ